jgi:hypothetical protein
MNRLISVLVIGGVIFVTAVGVLRSLSWPSRVAEAMLRMAAWALSVAAIGALVVVAVGIPILVAAFYLTDDGGALLGYSWASGFPILLPTYIVAVAAASHLRRAGPRLLAVMVGTGWWLLLPQGSYSFGEAAWVFLHAALVAVVWEALFRVRHRPLAGIPGRALTILRIEGSRRSDDPTPEERVPTAG